MPATPKARADLALSAPCSWPQRHGCPCISSVVGDDRKIVMSTPPTSPAQYLAPRGLLPSLQRGRLSSTAESAPLRDKQARTWRVRDLRLGRAPSAWSTLGSRVLPPGEARALPRERETLGRPERERCRRRRLDCLVAKSGAGRVMLQSAYDTYTGDF